MTSRQRESESQFLIVSKLSSRALAFSVAEGLSGLISGAVEEKLKIYVQLVLLNQYTVEFPCFSSFLLTSKRSSDLSESQLPSFSRLCLGWSHVALSAGSF